MERHREFLQAKFSSKVEILKKHRDDRKRVGVSPSCGFNSVRLEDAHDLISPASCVVCRYSGSDQSAANASGYRLMRVVGAESRRTRLPYVLFQQINFRTTFQKYAFCGLSLHPKRNALPPRQSRARNKNQSSNPVLRICACALMRQFIPKLPKF
jgi:hypothetical protein